MTRNQVMKWLYDEHSDTTEDFRVVDSGSGPEITEWGYGFAEPIEGELDTEGNANTWWLAYVSANAELQPDFNADQLDGQHGSYYRTATNMNAGVLAHERGGLEADVSAGAGYVRISGGATTVVKCNFGGFTDPGMSDDVTAGYSIGSRWLNTVTNDEFVCLFAGALTAIWKATVIHDHGTLPGLTDDDHTQYAKLTGRSGGQVLQGGTASGNRLDLESTTNATKGGVRIKAGDWLEVPEVTAPGTPGSGFARVYAKTDGKLYALSDGGTEYDLTLTPTGAGKLTFTAVKTSAYTAVAGDLVRCDTSGGAFTVTVPSSPAANDRYGVILTTEASGQANALTVSAGSGTHDNKLYCQNDYIIYQYDGAAWQTVDSDLRSHSAAAHLSANVTTNTAATAKKLVWDTQDHDVGGVLDITTNNRFDIRRTGTYQVTMNVRPYNNTGLASYYRGEIRVNGAVEASFGLQNVNSNNLVFCNGSKLLYLDAGDYVEGFFTAQSTDVGASGSMDDTFMGLTEER